MLQKCSCFRRDAVGSPQAKTSSQKLHSGKKWFLRWISCDSNMSPPSAENTIRAALLIQKWYRSYLARMEMRRRYSWTIFQSIEYSTEQDQVKLYNFFNALLMHMPNEANESHEVGKANTLKDDRIHSVELEIEEWEDKNYQGVKIGNQITKTDVENLIDLFRKRKDYKLRTKYVARLLQESTNCLKKFPNLNIASTAISKQITICGDIHGKLEDLLVIFHKNGLPSRENPYIFNGDFVDRGKKSLEVFLLLLACVLAFPGGIYLNRGNHEDSVMNARYGFIREVNNKYKKNGERLMKLIEEVYRWLPLGTLINNKILVVHGGISDTTDLSALKKLDRSKYTSILRPPVAEQGAGGIDKAEWKQIFDVMWSDPQRNDGCEPNTLRSAGTYFGPDITKSFLEKHGLDYIIRSHECKPNGYEVVHSGQVITIFSASNYYAVGSNKGAYLKVNPKLDTHFVQFTAEASRAKKLTFRERVGLVEDSAMKELGKMLSDKKNDIAKEFKKIDPENSGVISITQWCHALELATNLGLPWRLLKDKLAPEDDPANANSKTVHYQKTLDILSSDQFKMDNSTISVTSSLYKNRSSLEAIFKILDKDNSGYITLDEFGDACDLLSEFLPESDNKDQVLELCKMMDMNKDGQVDLNEFLEAFRLCEQASKDGSQQSEDL